MPTLREDLEERDAADLAAILDDPGTADVKLAALWQDVLGRRDPIEILGNAVLWCSLADIAGAVAECVRLVVGEHATLDTIERHARGQATLEEVWDATQEAKERVVDAITEAIVEAGEAAGGNMAGFDDEALDSAGRALTTVTEAGNDVVDILRRRLPPPTAAAFHAAHAARYS